MWKNSKTEPKKMAERIDGSTVELDLIPSADLFQFNGHFPDLPVLPGVAQLDWAIRFAKMYFPISQKVTEVSQLKFRNVIVPETCVTLKLDCQKEQNRVVFSYCNDTKVFSSGILKTVLS